MTQTHTPGPWTIRGLEESRHDYPDWQTYAIRSPQNVCLAVVGEVDRFESERILSNARLIAAAPDLLTALEALVASLEWEERRSGTTYAGYETARAAIARAKGE